MSEKTKLQQSRRTSYKRTHSLRIELNDEDWDKLNKLTGGIYGAKALLIRMLLRDFFARQEKQNQTERGQANGGS